MSGGKRRVRGGLIVSMMGRGGIYGVGRVEGVKTTAVPYWYLYLRYLRLRRGMVGEEGCDGGEVGLRGGKKWVWGMRALVLNLNLCE